MNKSSGDERLKIENICWQNIAGHFLSFDNGMYTIVTDNIISHNYGWIGEH